ncbi:MAG: hypothetical protein NTZ79_01630, partial [Proteobacteria bacterium]|nr:hypothetical protein [Pseudomonadota bacterium]
MAVKIIIRPNRDTWCRGVPVSCFASGTSFEATRMQQPNTATLTSRTAQSVIQASAMDLADLIVQSRFAQAIEAGVPRYSMHRRAVVAARDGLSDVLN